ncbi:Ig-like domain-containing protein [Vibrio vulnificus]|uniref:Ig-like domain-containing protein n=1 Tax=Vibrio vulnificus TaxID=672 RepID=UPI001594CB52|nr:Ig-like domain-containing protein [Vibrio vulnificus]EJE8554906.1 Ig-like domain-containing protein [Vibrio vulnificus]MCA3951561.1 Ig-like domain-containing protein [Vibrio vulnificus]NVD21331.1 hypothetical protein [Vibrio vulnificus]
MKARHSITTIIVALIVLIGLSGCYHSVKEVVVTPKQSTIPIGFQQPLKAENVYKKGKVVDATHTGEVKWRSSDESIATVDSHGLVSIYDKQGVVEITAVGNFKNRESADTVTLKVTGAFLTSITVTPKNQSTLVGLTKSYTATVLFSNEQTINVTNDNALSWTSSYSDISSVSNNIESKNLSTGVTTGEIFITAKRLTNDNSLENHVTLTITPPHTLSISVSTSEDANVINSSTVYYGRVLQRLNGKAHYTRWKRVFR